MKKLAWISSLLIILYQLTQWKLIELFTVFIVPFLGFLLYGFFIIVTVGSIFVIFKKKEWKPLLIQTITILIFIFVPFNQMILSLDFKQNRQEREEVVRMVEKGELKPNVSYDPNQIHLPNKYDQLSRGGGDILLKKENGRYWVFFFTFRGILDNYSGFVYSPFGEKPKNGLFQSEFVEIEKISHHWYFVSAT